MTARERFAELFAHGAPPRVAPSMLKCDFADLNAEITTLEAAGAQMLHWDVMDGHFVGNLTYGPPLLKSVRAATDLVFDAHLMISDPERYLDDYVEAGCDAITIHIEAVPDPRRLLQRIREAEVASGLALNPETPLERIEPYLSDCDLVLVMSVKPGFGGQAFQSVALDKLVRLRELLPPNIPLSVDGGIGPATIGDVATAGASQFVVGSALFETPDYAATIAELSRLAISTSGTRTPRG